MSVSRAAVWLFSALLRLYPGPFREAFGAEAAGVFAESMRQAERRGILPALAVGVRELADLPVNLAAEYWEDIHMKNLQLSQPVDRPVWWGAVGFGLAAASATLFQTVLYVPTGGALADAVEHWRFWGEFLVYAVLGGAGGFGFALVSRRFAKAGLYGIAGSFGFLIGHMVWYPVMVGSSVALFYSNAANTAFQAGNLIIHWSDIALMMSLSGLFIGWMEKSRPLALRLFGNGALGAGIGGLSGLGCAGWIWLLGSSAVERAVLVNGLLLIVNSLAGIFGGALLGRAVGRESGLRGTPAVS